MDEAQQNPKGWRGSREVWLTAAREAFVEGGIDAVKIQPLATALGLSRTSFYWFFDGRDAVLQALLGEWEASNTRSLIDASGAYAETVSEAALNVIAVFLPGGGFDPRLDFAVRGWAHQSDAVAATVQATDERRLEAIRAMFERFGFAAPDADVRARTMYLVQIGYISMQMQEDVALRLARIPAYVETFTGQAPQPPEMARFLARFGG